MSETAEAPRAVDRILQEILRRRDVASLREGGEMTRISTPSGRSYLLTQSEAAAFDKIEAAVRLRQFGMNGNRKMRRRARKLARGMGR
jgi:hypothetical protein